MDRKSRKAKTETPEELAKREAWKARLQEPIPDLFVDQGQLQRFLVALEEHRAEDARRRRSEQERAAALARLKALDAGRTSFASVGDVLAHGDAWEGPEPAGDIPPPLEV